MIVVEKTYFSTSQSFSLMTTKSITAGFPKDLREAYRLLLRYPLIWVPIVISLIGAGAWGGNMLARLDNNEAVLKSQEEATAIRAEERERCDKAMADYKEFVNKWIPNNGQNEK